ncbi:MAG: hypothetical protein K6G90_10245 [Clostridia bacterium]|nr:hypothetical protein [Clostridia bacterium]
MNAISLKDLLRTTIPDSVLFEKYWNGIRDNSCSLAKLCRENDFNAADDFEDLLAAYLREYPASSIYKERVIRPFIVEWYKAAAAYLGQSDDSETLFPHYVVIDKTVELLKALHPRNGATKADIGRKIGVYGKNLKTVQTDLRLLSPSPEMNGASYKGRRLSVGGHTVKIKVREIQDRGGQKRFLTPNTVHPLILLPNVTQVGNLLRALARLYKEEDNDVVATTGADIWLQLTDYCKERIRDVFAKEDKTLEAFLKDIGTFDYNSGSVGFVTEREMDGYISNISERLLLAGKAGRICDITLETEGERKTYKKQKISILKNGYYRATSADCPDISADFSEEDVYDIEFGGDWN